MRRIVMHLEDAITWFLARNEWGNLWTFRRRKCNLCGRKTHWLSCSFSARLCRPRCMDKAYKRYMRSCVNAIMSGSIKSWSKSKELS